MKELLRIGVLDFPPWWFVENGKTVTVRENKYMFLKDFYDFMVIHFNSSFIVGQFYGEEQQNGTWTGLMGGIQRDEVDIILLPGFPTYYHMRVAKYLSPIHYTYTTILSGARNFKPVIDGKYLCAALDIEVWIFLCFSLILVPLIFASVLKSRNIKSKMSSYPFFQFLGLLFSEEFHFQVKGFKESVILGTWFLGTMVIQSSYLSNLKATASITKYSTIDSYDDIAKRPNLRPVIFKGTYYERLFKHSPVRVNKEVYEMILKHDGALGLHDVFGKKIMDEVAEGTAVQIFDVIPLMFIMCAVECSTNDYLFSKEPITWHPIVFATNKNVSKTATLKLNRMFQLYSSSVQLKRYLRQVEIRSSTCVAESALTVATMQITFERIADSVVVYVSSIIVAFFVILAELIHIIGLFSFKSQKKEASTNSRLEILRV